MKLIGPKVGERWTIEGYTDLIYIGIGFNFENNKHLIFKDTSSSHADVYFIITKDEFYAADLYKEKQE